MAETESTYFDPNEFAVRDDGLEERHYWHIHRKRVLAHELGTYLGEDRTTARLIELGCGIGTTTTHLNAEGFHVDYSDVFPRALELAEKNARRRLGPAAETREFRARDVTQPLEALAHRGVLLLDVIEHLPDDVAALTHVREALGDGEDRFVLVTVPAFQFLWSP
ncbi:MAG: methyltransferase domain-containing protein, partial [Myxococcota bacterium]